MKVAIYGQYYQESTKPIIRDILNFFNQRKIEMVIEESFLAKIYEKELASRPYNTFSSHKDLDSSFDLFISIGGDGTILRAATLVRDSGIPVLGINAGRLGFLATVQKDNIDEFLQFIIEEKYTTSARTLLSLKCDPDIESIGELNFAMNDLHFSARAHDRILKVARTIADIDGSEEVRPQHLQEALQYRSLDRSMWV